MLGNAMNWTVNNYYFRDEYIQIAVRAALEFRDRQTLREAARFDEEVFSGCQATSENWPELPWAAGNTCSHRRRSKAVEPTEWAPRQDLPGAAAMFCMCD